MERNKSHPFFFSKIPKSSFYIDIEQIQDHQSVMFLNGIMFIVGYSNMNIFIFDSIIFTEITGKHKGDCRDEKVYSIAG
ncbi:hypothetical protein SAMN04488102_106114 [Alkalibacterium subtropicum]|uniref:Uncharacterized protein n=1 Tax=Alkalibacterium subtropicum TaxID=753702 RepID=A0A1I1J0Z5_9LACT|nr:hypothetical protein [Alkalibacterium subtropicum]SFC42259.1 hypothetical protein SAMN04488102_106114 [Alkalibacterium subtropicum]